MSKGGSHTNHINPELLKEQEIIGQISQSLERETNHHSGTGLITNFPQGMKAAETAVKIVSGILRMDFMIQELI